MSVKNTKTQQGFDAPTTIKLLRLIATVILKFLRIHGRSRWSNEFIQAIDPSIDVEIKDFLTVSPDPYIKFRTGHGRLFWRATETPGLDPQINEWIKDFASDDIFYDIGANIGVYSIMAAKFMKATVYAIEIDLMNTRMLYENIYLNNCQDKITVLPFGLDSRSHQEKLFLKTMSYGDALHNLRSANSTVINPSGIQFNVPVFALDDICDLLRMPSPTKLKIDIDGQDLAVLEGAINVLKTVTSLVIEYTPDSIDEAEIHNLLVANGFTFDFSSPQHFDWGQVDGFFSKRS
jgi:FkbM family methyltransferase